VNSTGASISDPDFAFNRQGARSPAKIHFTWIARATNGATGYTTQQEAVLTKGRAKLLKSKVLYQGKVFSLRRDTVIEPGGVRADRDIVVHPGSVVVLPIFQDGRVLLIRQYRHTVGDFLWELVAGRKEPQETPVVAARRELLEETGYTARRLRKLLHIIPTPGFVNEWMWIFAAEGLAEGAAQPEEDEKIVPRAFTLKQVDAMILSGRLRDAKSIAGLLYYMRYDKRFR
jgi:ADP-ribose pyrophosphatase